MMDAAFENPFEKHRLLHRKQSRVAAMDRMLTEAQFAQAVDDSLPRLISMARRLAGNDDLASESVQNALLKASKSWRRFRGQSSVQTWLTRIVIHCVRDAIAAERKRIERNQPHPFHDSDESIDAIPDHDQGPSQQAIDGECRRAVREAVQHLPHRQREVFTLMVWHGMTASEVGSLLEIKPQTVYSNLHAARKQLRSTLDRFMREAGDGS